MSILGGRYAVPLIFKAAEFGGIIERSCPATSPPLSIDYNGNYNGKYAGDPRCHCPADSRVDSFFCVITTLPATW